MNKEQKKQQEVINYLAENLYDMAFNEATNHKGFPMWEERKWKQLAHCQAWVYETENFYILRSYNTIVAVIEKATGICADVLRLVYGFTSTSCQHISKFRKAYGKDKWGCKIEYTYRQIS